jgi:hypothetical protein
LNAAVAELGRRVASEPDGGEALTIDQVAVLKSAGMSDRMIGRLLQEEGLEADDLAGYALTDETSDPIIVFTKCLLGTCKDVTLVIGCTISVKPGPLT